MGFFYVFIRNDSDEYLTNTAIAFISYEVADEWWRAMSGHAEWCKLIERVSPRLYIYRFQYGMKIDGLNSLYNHALSERTFPQFKSHVLRLGDHCQPEDIRTAVQDSVDLASGNSFFIRSKAEPYDYWFCPTSFGSITAGTKIYTSREERTRFRVRIADAQMAPGTIMIGSDEIVVSLAFAPDLQVSVENGVVVAESAGAGADAAKLKLSDVRAGFASGGRRRVVDDQNDSDIVVKELIEAKDGSGEGWELV
ncbi:hypothetical protein HWV62_38276 [Athelia sp. TMB]|nr:hypothetical protein HWV62_38276 [Athelia sp. TMB]